MVRTSTTIRIPDFTNFDEIPISLPLDNPEPLFVTLLGWGRTETFEDLSEQLQVLDKKLWTSGRQCLHEMEGSHPWFDENKICTFTR